MPSRAVLFAGLVVNETKAWSAHVDSWLDRETRDGIAKRRQVPLTARPLDHLFMPLPAASLTPVNPPYE